MWKTAFMLHVGIGMLCSVAASADEKVTLSAIADVTAVAGDPPAALLNDPWYSTGLPPGHGLNTETNSGRRSRPITEIYFHDDNALARLSKIRNLSLLTLSQTARTRLFLGVNADGLVGLHFVSLPNHGEERFLSLARLPRFTQKSP